MIKVIDGVLLNRTDAGDRWQVSLVSESVPASLSITGADVDEMDDTAIIAVGSVLVTPDTDFVAFEDGVFTQKG